MNQGICYLYEYENDCRKRNIGFLQITQHYHSCRISLHLKALPVPPRTTLELHAFYLKASALIHTPAAILNYSGGSIATQLSISESLFPEGKTLDEIDGFLLLPQNSNHQFLWIASRNALPVSFVIASDTENSSEENEDEISLQAASLQDSDSETSLSQETSAASETSEISENLEANISDGIQEDDRNNFDTIENAAVTQTETPVPKSVVVGSDSSANLNRITDSDDPQTAADSTFESGESQNTIPESNANKKSGPITISNPTIKTENSIIITNPVIENRKTSINSNSAINSKEPATESNSTTPLRENAIAPDSDSGKATESTDSVDSTNSATSSAQQQTNDTPSLSARKITRKELSILPRKFWGLANNSFLLHGYHNYDHLLLIEEDGHVWLGVPGIYDAREARAAELFGFPQFTRSYVPLLNLTDEERDEQGDFGHWCRYLNF